VSSEIWHSHGGSCENYSLLGFDDMHGWQYVSGASARTLRNF
jgi:hypothetical protein